MEISNYAMLGFILLLIHDLRHDFNYGRWNRTIYEYCNDPSNPIIIELKASQQVAGGNGDDDKEQIQIQIQEQIQEPLLILSIIQGLIQQGEIKQQFFELMILTLGYIDNDINPNEVEKAFIKSFIVLRNNARSSKNSSVEQEGLDTLFVCTNLVLQYLVKSRDEPITIIASNEYYELVVGLYIIVQSDSMFDRQKDKPVYDSIEKFKSDKSFKSQNSDIEKLYIDLKNIYDIYEIYREKSVDYIGGGGWNNLTANHMEPLLRYLQTTRRSSLGLSGPNFPADKKNKQHREDWLKAIQEANGGPPTSEEIAGFFIDYNKQATAAAASSRPTRDVERVTSVKAEELAREADPSFKRANKEQADAATKLKEAQQLARDTRHEKEHAAAQKAAVDKLSDQDVQHDANMKFANKILYLVTKKLLQHLTDFETACPSPTDQVEIEAKNFYHEHKSFLDSLVHPRTLNQQTQTSVDGKLIQWFRSFIGFLAAAAADPASNFPAHIKDILNDIVIRDGYSVHQTRNTIYNPDYNKNKYIIDNASKIQDLWGEPPTSHEYIFCPNSSNIDPAHIGVCNAKSARSYGIENGDMHVQFESRSNPTSPNCIIAYSAYIPDANTLGYSIAFNCKGSSVSYGNPRIGEITILKDPSNYKDNTLSVANTFLAVCKRLVTKLKTKPGGVDMWAYVRDDTNLLPDLISIILRKSKGDLMQELNAVLRRGGYTAPPTYNPTTFEYFKWQPDGYALRCFAANDVPSAIRFIFIKIFFPQQYINQKSFGGLITQQTNGSKNIFVVKAPDLSPDGLNGGSKQKQKQKKTKKNKKNKKMKNNKKLKKTKKSKTKKNRKTKKSKKTKNNRKNRRTNKLHKLNY
jgi:hypothetical protein